jgi:hypothetical protein
MCLHPSYKIVEKVSKPINCYSLEQSPIKPKELVNIEREREELKLEGNQIELTDSNGGTFTLHYTTDKEEFKKSIKTDNKIELAETNKQIKFDINKNDGEDEDEDDDVDDNDSRGVKGPPKIPQNEPKEFASLKRNEEKIKQKIFTDQQERAKINPDIEKNTVKSFLAGVQCLHGVIISILNDV